MAKQEYAKLLLDPRWLAKRKEVLRRDSYTCVQCYKVAGEVILHVHHKVYYWNRDPWDYSNNELETLCAGCHWKEHNLISNTREPERKYQHLLIKQQSESYLTASQTHLDMLMDKLQEGVGASLEVEILKNIVFLQKKRKEYLRG